MQNVLVMIEGVYLQKLLINADTVCLLVCSWSFDVFLLYFMYIILYEIVKFLHSITHLDSAPGGRFSEAVIDIEID